MSTQTSTTEENQTPFDLDSEIKKAQDILSESNLSLTKLADFVENFTSKMQEKYPKMMEIAMSAASSVQQSGPAAQAAEEEVNSFDVVITDVGSKKLNLIKEVRAISGLGLADSKAMVDNIASKGKATLKSSVDKKDAEEMKKKIEAVGAKVDLVPAKD